MQQETETLLCVGSIHILSSSTCIKLQKTTPIRISRNLYEIQKVINLEIDFDKFEESEKLKTPHSWSPNDEITNRILMVNVVSIGS